MLLTHRSVLALFARWPEPGRVKTRLAKAVGDRRAASIYDQMLRAVIAEHKERAYDLVAFVTPPDKTAPFAIEYGVEVREQRGDDLGARMAHCFTTLLERYDRVLIGGSDIPGLTAERALEAFAALDRADVVVGPCPDGGYYLIGASRVPDVFTGIPWSTANVLPMTVDRLSAADLSFTLLPMERDVDTPDDLEILGLAD